MHPPPLYVKDMYSIYCTASSRLNINHETVKCICAISVADPDPEISPPNPDPDPALVVLKKIYISVQYRAYVYLFTP